jgi:1-acyl-sn-glycerol-3-phosphate acyltransferase
VLLHTDPPRLVRPLTDRFVQRLPGVRSFFERTGPVIASSESFRALLRDGHAVLVFPEGVDGIRKTVSQRYRLQPFHKGFVRQALLAGAPIVPVAIVGADDQAPILYDVKPLARRLGLPVAPITPTFPWLGPAGLLPYPVGYRVVYGAPLVLSDRYGPEAAEDGRLVDSLANQVRRTIQRMVDAERS